MNILILSAGRRMSLFKIFQEELKRFFPSGIVFTVDANPNRSPVCQTNKSFSGEIPRVSAENYVKKLLDFVRVHEIAIIIPTIDTELSILSQSKALFLNNGCQIVISDPEFIAQCQDKSNQKNFFKQFEIDTPLILDKDNLVFPAFAKPKNGSRSQGIIYLNEVNDLSDNILKNEDLIFMELISKDEFKEFTVDMYFSKESKLLSLVPRERLSVRDGEVSIGRTVKSNLYNILVQKFKFIQGAHGCITAQFFYSSRLDKILGIEINPRFGGGYPLSYHAGANFQENIIKEYGLKEKKLELDDQWTDQMVMLRHDSEIYYQE